MTNSRAKGIRGELEAAKLWQRWFPEARRSFGQAREGFEQPDLLSSGPFYIEVKRRKRKPRAKIIEEWWEKTVSDMNAYEASDDADDDMKHWPILMWREDGGGWKVMLRGEDARDMFLLDTSRFSIPVTMVGADWEVFEKYMDENYPINP